MALTENADQGHAKLLTFLNPQISTIQAHTIVGP
jgi:hypothetical protein